MLYADHPCSKAPSQLPLGWAHIYMKLIPISTSAPHAYSLGSFPLSLPSSLLTSLPFFLPWLLLLSSTFPHAQVCVPARQWCLLCQLRDHGSFAWHRHGAVAPGIIIPVHHPPLLLQIRARQSPHQKGMCQALP